MAKKTDKKKKIAITEIDLSKSLQDKQTAMDSELLKKLGKEKDLDALISKMYENIGKRNTPPRLAFTEDPAKKFSSGGIFEQKVDLLEDGTIKKIRIRNHLVASILEARGNVLYMLSIPRTSRYDVGSEIKIKPEIEKYIPHDKMPLIQARIDNFRNILQNCGHKGNMKMSKWMDFPTYMKLITKNGIAFGRHATEIVRDEYGNFSYFRPVDVATIMRSNVKNNEAQGIRQRATHDLEQMEGVRLNSEQKKDISNVDWVQVIDGIPKQVFSEKDMLVYTLYPSTDIENKGYPLTPIDTVINAITAHMNIEQYNNLYFQNGRASKGFLVIKSSDIDQNTLELIKQTYYASIDNVNNSFRAPVFAVDTEDDVNWVPTSPSSRDIEFGYLYDSVTRNILAAFGMSPDELPGFNHLSKGTNQSALSESNNEYKLLAARDIGIKPLIKIQQNFLNSYLFPLIDPELSKLCNIVLAGFDAEDREKEINRIQMESPLHYNYDDLLNEVEKETVGEMLGGRVPFNERYQQAIAGLSYINELRHCFYNDPAAFCDIFNRYKRDPFFFQFLSMLQQSNPIAYRAFFARKKNNMQILKMLIKDTLDDMDLE